MWFVLWLLQEIHMYIHVCTKQKWSILGYGMQ